MSVAFAPTAWPAAVENGPYVGAGLRIWRDAVVAPHGAGPGVVGGAGEHGPELVGEAAQVGDAGVDILAGVEGVGDAEVALRARHQLHQALGSGGRLRGCAVPGLDGDDGVHQVGVDAVPLGSRVDDAGEQPLAGLGRAHEQAGGGNEQQDHEATEGGARRHGERAPYHIKNRTPRVDWRSYPAEQRVVEPRRIWKSGTAIGERPAADRHSSSGDASRAAGDETGTVLGLPGALCGRRAAAVAGDVPGLWR